LQFNGVNSANDPKHTFLASIAGGPIEQRTKMKPSAKTEGFKWKQQTVLGRYPAAPITLAGTSNRRAANVRQR
jgi:hypothetical protein